MGSSNVGALTVWILVLMLNDECQSRVNYDILECQDCSLKNEVPCSIQVMHDNCLSAMTAIHGKVWPGPPRELNVSSKRVKNETLAQFSWKPPYDASIRSLKGFLLRVNTYEDHEGHFITGAPWCFFLNLTNSSWTDSVDAYDTTFQFSCIKSSNPASVTLSVSSIPKPHKNWSMESISIHLEGTVPYYNWKPEITVTEDGTNNCVNVAVKPPFPHADSHMVGLYLQKKTIKEASFKPPYNNVTLCLSPGENYSIQVKPYDENHQALSYSVRYGPVWVEGFERTTILSPGGQKNKPSVVIYGLIPVILVLTISILAFIFYHRGMFRKCDLLGKPLTTTENDGRGNIKLTIVYCSENEYVENVVNSIKILIQETMGIEPELVCDESAIESNRKQVFIITEGVHRINHINSTTLSSYHASKAFLSGKAFLQRFTNIQDEQPLALLLSPIVTINWLDCCVFKNKKVPRIYQISDDNENIELDYGQMASFLGSLNKSDNSIDDIRSNLINNPTMVTFRNQLQQLYLYMRDNQKWFEEDFLESGGQDDSHQTHPLLPFNVPQDPYNAHFIDQVCLNQINEQSCYHYEPHTIQTHYFVQGPEQVGVYPLKTTPTSLQVDTSPTGKQTSFDPDFFDSGISELEIKLDPLQKTDGRLDSGLDSIPNDELLQMTESPPDFIPPESDSDSYDVDATSLGQHMLEINKGHLCV